MKPLELTVYPHVMDAGFDCIEDHEGTLRIDRELDDFAQAKRLTDAELAAEKWHAATEATYARARVDACLDNPLPITADKAEYLVGVLHRFATLPHYDQEEDQA